MTVSLTLNHDLAYITLDNPEKHNAFDNTIIELLIQAFNDASSNDQVRIILLSANGKHFSAGADLSWMKRMGELDYEQNLADSLRLAELMSTIDRAGKPVICRIQGAAFGGALGLICACDIAIASNDARFCLSEVKLGILPAVISPYVVRAIGARQAQRYFMSAEVISAAVAERLGIVHEQVPSDQLDSRIQAIIVALRQGAPKAQLKSRDLIEAVSARPIDTHVIHHTAELIAALRTADEGREGLGAFLEKRPAHWSIQTGADND
ncbi:MAG: enoyl-CoA hydratase [Gammaproteobacteria bacterium HGW-Gammaproteobacteria-14]|nr:MAG: enoyl-CoA hydratase [Gammaproteobacteria bacterium HGW-Gammaproteobacteria-14]